MSDLRLWSDQAGRILDDGDRYPDLLGIGAASIRQCRSAGSALEKLHAKERLQLLDLMANSRRGDPKLLGSPRETLVSRGGLKYKQTL